MFAFAFALVERGECLFGFLFDFTVVFALLSSHCCDVCIAFCCHAHNGCVRVRVRSRCFVRVRAFALFERGERLFAFEFYGLEIGICCVRVRARLNDCCVSLAVRGERLSEFYERCSSPVLVESE